MCLQKALRECCGETCLPPAEMGSPRSSQRLSNAASLAAGRPRCEQGGTSSTLPASSFPQYAALPQALCRLSYGPAGSQPFLSLTHTLGKASDSNELVKWGTDQGSPISLTRPPPHSSDTARKMEAGQIFPPVEALGLFWQVLSAHCKHPPQWRPSKDAQCECETWKRFKHLSPKLGSSKLVSSDDHSQRHLTSKEGSVFDTGVSQTLTALPACICPSLPVPHRPQTSDKTHPPNRLRLASHDTGFNAHTLISYTHTHPIPT